MYIRNYFRDEESEDYGFDEMSVPTWCPFCEGFNEESYFDDLERQPNPNDEMPFGAQGMPYGPQGKPNAPQGVPFQPQGKPYGKQGEPSGPPPSITPSKQQATMKYGHGPSPKYVEPGTIRHCLYRYVYIWPRNGRGFWAWLNYVGRRSVSGYRWNGHRWVYFGMDLRQIESFSCY